MSTGNSDIIIYGVHAFVYFVCTMNMNLHSHRHFIYHSKDIGIVYETSVCTIFQENYILIIWETFSCPKTLPHQIEINMIVSNGSGIYVLCKI